MIQIDVAVAIRENTADGAIVMVGTQETVPANHADEAGHWLQIQEALRRLVEDEMLPKAMIQVEQWKMRAES
jgi:hypothetical protein